MKGLKIVLIVMGVLSTQVVFANTNVEVGRQLYEQNCSVCHSATSGMDMSKRLAPPIIGVKMHYQKKFKDKESFVAAVAAWVVKPEKDKSLMKRAIDQFSLMPALPLPRKDLEKIATYMYEGELDKPGRFDEHVAGMRGTRGGKGGKHVRAKEEECD